MSAVPVAVDGLTAAQFKRVCEWMYRRTGIQFAESKRYFVDKRVQACVAAHGGSFDAWFSGLRLGADLASAQRLINELTVNETYFLREDHQFDSLVNSVLPEIVAKRRADRSKEPIRILSLPCSTGEEPYSVALRMLEWSGIDTFEIQIVAGDIDTRVLDQARQGEYGPRSMQRVPIPIRTRWFDRISADTYQVKQDIRDAIDFSIINVTDTDNMRGFRNFDVAFCRNLLIYFDQISSRRAVENLFGALRPGGYLFLGHSESMSRISAIFSPVRMPEGVIYQRPALGVQPS